MQKLSNKQSTKVICKLDRLSVVRLTDLVTVIVVLTS